MDNQWYQLVSFAGSTIAIQAKGVAAIEIVAFLYQDVILMSTGDEGVPHTQFCLNSPKDKNNTFDLFQDGCLIFQSHVAASVAERLLGESCYQLANRSEDGLLFHAAAVRQDNKGILLAGESGAGKTTLAAWLLTQGFDYLTDELVFIPFHSRKMQSFSRPLNLKPSARPILQQFVNVATIQAQGLFSETADLIPATAFQSTPPSVDVSIDLVIFPRYTNQPNYPLQALSKAQAGLALMETLVNARNLPQHGFREIARLARQTPAYKVQYDHFQQFEIVLHNLGVW